MRTLLTQDFPRKCSICEGEYRLPTFDDAIVGHVNCSGSCNSYYRLWEGDVREAVERGRKDILRSAGVVVK